ncbi:MAG: serine hydrolase [Bacteroidales bacterium]|nr:serine hydrolase [Bacteroidales bacterium]
MKKIKLFLFVLLIVLSFKQSASAQGLYFPPLVGNTWDTISPQSLGWCLPEIDLLYNYLDQVNTKAFIVLKDGKIVLEKYFGSFVADSLWYWASAGKSLTAFTVGIAQQEGFLAIGDSTSKYLGAGWTSCLPEQEGLITIRHQLTMTSGLDDGVSDNHCTLDTCLNYLAPAGSRWSYHNGPYTLLDGVIQVATGQTLNSYINQKIKAYTGMTGMFVNVGYNNVFFSTARSMARFGILILNKGKWAAAPVMTDSVYFNAMVNTSQGLNESYGYLWWLNGKNSFMMPTLQYVFNGSLSPAAPSDMFSALGKNGQILNIVPSQNLVMVRMGDSPSSGDIASLLNDTIWQKMNAVMCNTSVVDFSSGAKEPTIYPNPANGSFNVSCNNNFNLEIYSVTGVPVLSMSDCINTVEINTEKLKTGLYMVKITDSNGRIQIKKLSVQK